MSEVHLPRSGKSAQLHYQSLSDVIERYAFDDEPVHYERAAVNVNAPDCSSCLKFFGEIGLLQVEKQGVYIPPTYLVNYFRKLGATKEEAKEELIDQLEEYEIYSEVAFQVQQHERTVHELAENVAGQVGVDKDKVGQVRTAIEILEHLELISEDDESGAVRLVDQKKETGTVDPADEEITQGTKKPEGEAKPAVDGGGSKMVREFERHGLNINLEMTMELSEMEPSDIKERLEIVKEFLNNAE